MLMITMATTFVSGVMLSNPDQSTAALAFEAMTFPAALLSMLIAHEMGHYLACRYHGLDVTLPMFIPGPPFPIGIGTFGAFIRIRSAIRRRAELLDVGAAGPLAGVVMAIAWSAFGLMLSPVQAVAPAAGETLVFGESALFLLLRYAIHGVLPEGQDVIMHPIAMAGWLGMFVTSLNLLAAGQLDGGHITHALFGHRHRYISRAVFVGLVTWGVAGDPLLDLWWTYPFMIGLPALALVLSLRTWRRKVPRKVFVGPVVLYLVLQMAAGVGSASSMWLVWGLLVFVFGIDHPPVADLERKLSPGRWAIGLLSLLVFVGTFIPMPIKVLG
jgi:membrane-associated protease RseP (regulator of RpoE activity)